MRAPDKQGAALAEAHFRELRWRAVQMGRLLFLTSGLMALGVGVQAYLSIQAPGYPSGWGPAGRYWIGVLVGEVTLAEVVAGLLLLAGAVWWLGQRREAVFAWADWSERIRLLSPRDAEGLVRGRARLWATERQRARRRVLWTGVGLSAGVVGVLALDLGLQPLPPLPGWLPGWELLALVVALAPAAAGAAGAASPAPGRWQARGGPSEAREAVGRFPVGAAAAQEPFGPLVKALEAVVDRLTKAAEASRGALDWTLGAVLAGSIAELFGVGLVWFIGQGSDGVVVPFGNADWLNLDLVVLLAGLAGLAGLWAWVRRPDPTAGALMDPRRLDVENALALSAFAPTAIELDRRFRAGLAGLAGVSAVFFEVWTAGVLQPGLGAVAWWAGGAGSTIQALAAGATALLLLLELLPIPLLVLALVWALRRHSEAMLAEREVVGIIDAINGLRPDFWEQG